MAAETRRAPNRAHHAPDGGFRNPWPSAGSFDGRGNGFLRWQWERLRQTRAPRPGNDDLPRAAPEIARPHAGRAELRITWVGHSTLLVQIGTLNLLTDPVWSRRASPVGWAGPSRYTPPGVEFGALPDIHAVLLSHDHYDHLDRRTVDLLHERFGDAITWITPLGYRSLLAQHGIHRHVELDWNEPTRLPEHETTIYALPAQHWTRRAFSPLNARLWCSYAVLRENGPRFYFAGDSGYCPGFAAIAQYGPFDALAIPIGAYEPRWFMKPAHMNPEEALQTYLDLGACGVFCGIHWGTFRLTDEPPLEPPARTRELWRALRLPETDLWVPRHGETRRVLVSAAEASKRLNG